MVIVFLLCCDNIFWFVLEILHTVDGGTSGTSPVNFACSHPMTPTLKLAAVLAAIGGLLFGYDIGIISGAILQLEVRSAIVLVVWGAV